MSWGALVWDQDHNFLIQSGDFKWSSQSTHSYTVCGMGWAKAHGQSTTPLYNWSSPPQPGCGKQRSESELLLARGQRMGATWTHSQLQLFLGRGQLEALTQSLGIWGERFWLDKNTHVWLVVWNICYVFHILGMSSSQLTNSMIFQRGISIPPTRHVMLKERMDSAEVKPWARNPGDSRTSDGIQKMSRASQSER